MGWGILTVLWLGALALLLVSAGIQDARTREIANWKSAAIALLAPGWWVINALPLWPDVAIQVALAAGVFALFVGLFALGWMGGGDVKLIGAIALWLPLTPLVGMLAVMSVVGGLVTIVLIAEQRLRRKQSPIEVPYGVAIAIAALLALREPILNGFS